MATLKRARDLLHRVQGELAALAGLLHLLVGELFGRGRHQVVVAQSPCLHHPVERLRAVVAFASVGPCRGV